MLRKLDSQQVAEKWDVIAPLIEQSVPGVEKITHRVLNNILTMVLNNTLECFTFYKNKEDKNPIAYFMLAFKIDPFTNMTAAYIQSLTSFKVFSRGAWRQLLAEITEYAKNRGATNMFAQINSDKMEGIGTLLKAKKCTVLAWEI